MLRKTASGNTHCETIATKKYHSIASITCGTSGDKGNSHHNEAFAVKTVQQRRQVSTNQGRVINSMGTHHRPAKYPQRCVPKIRYLEWKVSWLLTRGYVRYEPVPQNLGQHLPSFRRQGARLFWANTSSPMDILEMTLQLVFARKSVSTASLTARKAARVLGCL